MIHPVHFHQFAILTALGLLLAPAMPLNGQKPAAKQPRPRATEKTVKSSATSRADEKQLAQLARALRDEESAAAYTRLSQFAAQESASKLGARAALALGYYDFTKARHAQALEWCMKAESDTLLREYVVYWKTQARLALDRKAEALTQLESFRREFRESVMTEQAVRSLAETALAFSKPERAVAALDSYVELAAKPALLLLRAQALEKAARDQQDSVAAVRDYRVIYYKFPLSDEAETAGKRLKALESSLGKVLGGVSIEMQMGRAAAFYDARRWREARSEYEKLLPQLRKAAADAEWGRAQLRSAQSRLQLGAGPGVLTSLALADPELEAERLYALSQAHRSKKQETAMLDAIEQLAARYPQSRWAEEGLFAAGNYFWVNLDRTRAASFYRSVLERFAAGNHAQTAHWRLAWVSYLERRAEAAKMLEEHLRRFPGSSYAPNALYWLGRVTESGGDVAHARSFYLKAQERFPQSYFGRQSAERLRVLGAAPVNSAGFLGLIPSAPRLPSLEERIPAAVSARWERAQALRTIAFDSSAELELRTAYGATGVPRLLWEAAQAALDAGRYTVAINTARQVYPQLESRKIEAVPQAVWRTVFPLPNEDSLRSTSARRGVDPMLVAGLIRQESIFQPDAISRAGAVGLMQVLPKTGRKLARQMKVRYSRAKLLNPDFNLQLGTLYLAELLKTHRSPEAALAAYNAGEKRVVVWEAERSFAEPAEFVESIPFTETREYVQNVMRNAEIYRLVYGSVRSANE